MFPFLKSTVSMVGWPSGAGISTDTRAGFLGGGTRLSMIRINRPAPMRTNNTAPAMRARVTYAFTPCASHSGSCGVRQRDIPHEAKRTASPITCDHDKAELGPIHGITKQNRKTVRTTLSRTVGGL